MKEKGRSRKDGSLDDPLFSIPLLRRESCSCDVLIWFTAFVSKPDIPLSDPHSDSAVTSAREDTLKYHLLANLLVWSLGLPTSLQPKTLTRDDTRAQTNRKDKATDESPGLARV
jgi:hypothetical protein